MGFSLTCHSETLVYHWLFFAWADLERIEKNKILPKKMNPRNLNLEVSMYNTIPALVPEALRFMFAAGTELLRLYQEG